MLAPPAALLFDVFGTCVDWRSGVARAVRDAAAPLGVGVDAGAVADAWRARYQPQLETVRSGARPWVDLDALHREALDEVLAAHGLDALDARARDELTLAWHRLDPWPDTVPALARMRRHAVVAPVSNGHIALIVAMSRRAGMVWDAVLGAEIARAYKPQPEVYLRAVSALGLRPPDAMMVACHASDLVAADACGLRTAFVRRPLEHGPGGPPEAPPDVAGLVADDLGALADALGSPS